MAHFFIKAPAYIHYFDIYLEILRSFTYNPNFAERYLTVGYCMKKLKISKHINNIF